MSVKKILVIEDDPDIMTILKAQLILDKFEVQGASTGEEGLELFKSWGPDLVVLDMNLPDIDGLDVCARIREFSDAPVVAVTARDSISDKLRGFQFGVDDYVTKPFEYLELKARIDVCMRRGASHGGSQRLGSGNVRIFPRERRVKVNDRMIDLTNKEFDLLELLTSRPGEVLTREYLCSKLWPSSNLETPTRALDVQVRRLRKKIEPEPERPQFIVTHPGVGYRFENG